MGRTSIENPSPSNSESESVADLRLPQDLITEILLYLPVKSLVKFKCVSKPWLYLISSSQFIKSHFSKSLKEGSHFNHQLLFAAQPSGMKQCSLSAALHNPSCTNVSDIEYPSRKPESSLRIVGIVNGLVCLAVGRKDLYVWNPILKQSKRLPGSRSSLKCCNFVVHGFGYIESNDDYKVVKVSCVVRDGVYQSKVKVYSLRSDSWRRIEGFKGGVPFSDGTYANGKMLWTTIRVFGSGEKWKIVSLDMASDKYEEVQGPGYEAGAFHCVIGSFGGSLYMLCEYYETKADLWVKDKNGVEESWSKVFSIRYDDIHSSAPFFAKSVVCILGDGEVVVLEDRSRLIVYSTKKKDLRNIELDGFSYFVYVESLVSPT